MMRSTGQVLTFAGLLTLATTGLVAAPASAATPPEVTHTKVDVSLTGIDVCGFTVDSVIRGTDTFKVVTDASGDLSFQDTAHVVSTLTNSANGKVVHVSNSGRDAFSDAGVLNPDGTYTYTDTLTGMDMRVYTSHSNTLLKDAGFLSIMDTVDADGNFLDQTVVVHGPHQFAGDFDAFCDAISTAIG
jgi:hypothetical protein